MKRTLLLTITLLLAITMSAQQKYVGGDISMLPEYEKYGAQYFDKSGNDISGKLLEFFTEQGWNAARVRLFVDPSKASAEHQAEGVRQDLEFVKTLGKRIKDAGMTFMLDFHYSDTWTDPGKHSTPASWNSSDPDELATMLYNYTIDCLQQLKTAGATPDFIQVGNEITTGMLWPTGEISKGGSTWDNLGKYLKKGIQACREECPQAKIIIHTEMHNTSSLLNFYKTLKIYTDDYDVIGISYYPHYHGVLNTLNSVLNTLESTYPDKEIQIVETAYYHKWYPDDAKYSIDNFPNWPATEAGQQQFTKDLITALNGHSKVNGLYWWAPECNEYGVDSSNPVTSHWCNYSLFDNETGNVMSALYELKKFVDDGGSEEETDITNQFANMAFETGDETGWNINYEGWSSGPYPTVKSQWHSTLTSGNYVLQGWTETPSSLPTDAELISQTLENMPAGAYTVSAIVHSDLDGIYLFANDETKKINPTTEWGTAYSVSVTTTLNETGPLTVGLKLFNPTPTKSGEGNIYADNFTCTQQTSSIAAINRETMTDNRYYTLDGRQIIGKPAQKGIYINSGRKVIVK